MRRGSAIIRQLLSARGALPPESQQRLDRIAAMFLPEPEVAAVAAEPVAAKPVPAGVKKTAPKAALAKPMPSGPIPKRSAGATTGKRKPT